MTWCLGGFSLRPVSQGCVLDKPLGSLVGEEKRKERAMRVTGVLCTFASCFFGFPCFVEGKRKNRAMRARMSGLPHVFLPFPSVFLLLLLLLYLRVCTLRAPVQTVHPLFRQLLSPRVTKFLAASTPTCPDPEKMSALHARPLNNLQTPCTPQDQLLELRTY